MTAAPRAHHSTATLVDLAIDVMERDGLERLSMRTLGNAAGMQAASLYWYFRSKDELLCRITDRLMRMAAETVQMRRRPAETAADALNEFGMVYREFLMLHRDAATVMSMCQTAGAGLAELVGPIGQDLTGWGLTTFRAARAIRMVMVLAQGAALAAKARLAVTGAPNAVTLSEWVEALEAVGEEGHPFVLAAAQWLKPTDVATFRGELWDLVVALT